MANPASHGLGFERHREIDIIILLSFLLLIGFPLLYLFRHLDDNTLTSWRWVFRSPDEMMRMFFMLLPGVLLSIAISRISINSVRIPFLLFALSFIAAMPVWSEPEVILDASRYFLQAKHLSQYGVGYFLAEWGREISAWTDLPAVPFLYGLIFRYIGEARIWIQICNTILFSLTVVLTYSIGRGLWNSSAGMYASLMLIGIPYLLIQVPLMLVDVPVMFLLALSIYTYLSGLERGGMLRISLSTCIITITVFSKYSAWPMLMVLVAATIVSFKSGGMAAIRRAIVILTGAAVVSAMIILSRYELLAEQLRLLRTYQWPGLGRWKEGFVSTLFFQVHPFVSMLAAGGAVAAILKRDMRFLIPGWFAVFVFGLGVERARYILPLFPFLALMGAYGLMELPVSARIKRFVVSLIVTSSLTLTVGAYLPFLKSGSMANIEHAGRYIDTLPKDKVEVLILPQRGSSGSTEAAIPLLDLYTGKEIVYREQHYSPRDYHAGLVSPLRFTWEIRLNRLYAQGTGGTDVPIVVIADDVGAVYARTRITERHGITAMRTFDNDTGTFRYKTVVVIFGREPSGRNSTASITDCPVRASPTDRHD